MESDRQYVKGEGRKLPKPNNVVPIPTTLDTDFFKWWCIVLRPIVSLTNREVEVVASYLKQRWKLSKAISDPTLLDKMMMSEDIKKVIQKECNLTSKHFYVLISNLKKNKVIIGNSLNPRLIPNIRQDDNGVFQLLFLFKDPRPTS